METLVLWNTNKVPSSVWFFVCREVKLNSEKVRFQIDKERVTSAVVMQFVSEPKRCFSTLSSCVTSAKLSLAAWRVLRGMCLLRGQ